MYDLHGYERDVIVACGEYYIYNSEALKRDPESYLLAICPALGWLRNCSVGSQIRKALKTKFKNHALEINSLVLKKDPLSEFLTESVTAAFANDIDKDNILTYFKDYRGGSYRCTLVRIPNFIIFIEFTWIVCFFIGDNIIERITTNNG